MPTEQRTPHELSTEERGELDEWEDDDGERSMSERPPREPTAQERAAMHQWTNAEIEIVERLLSAAGQDFGDAIAQAGSPEHARLVGLAWAEALWASNGGPFDTPTGPMTYWQACEGVSQMSRGRFRATL
jgi:hypothetical protein